MEENNNSAKQIVPGTAPIAGANIEVIADVSPDRYPNGLEVVIFAPGDLTPLGKFVLKPRCMLAGLGPELARQLRAAMRQAQQQAAAPGQVKAPGL